MPPQVDWTFFNLYLNDPPEQKLARFEQDMQESLMRAHLWSRDGQHVGWVDLWKEVRSRPNATTGESEPVLVFHVINNMRKTPPPAPKFGRVNDYNQPYLTFAEAREVAEKIFLAALRRKYWVPFDRMKELTAAAGIQSAFGLSHTFR